MGCLYYVKPTLLFDANGSYRPFGLGYSNKTILPIWLATLFISIISYLGIHFFSYHFDHIYVKYIDYN
jgi:hypothetical protein